LGLNDYVEGEGISSLKAILGKRGEMDPTGGGSKDGGEATTSKRHDQGETSSICEKGRKVGDEIRSGKVERH